MKRRNSLMTAMLIGLMIVGSVTALAQEKKVKASKEVVTKKVKQAEEVPTKMTLGEAAKLSPSTLLSMAKELELTEVQQKKLWMVMQEMHAKTGEILTKDQLIKVKTWKPIPTMAEKINMAAKSEKIKKPQE